VSAPSRFVASLVPARLLHIAYDACVYKGISECDVSMMTLSWPRRRELCKGMANCGRVALSVTYWLLCDAQQAGVLCLMDIAAGMEHLHSLGVLHVRSRALDPPLTRVSCTPDGWLIQDCSLMS
jgi:hypothetical protein